MLATELRVLEFRNIASVFMGISNPTTIGITGFLYVPYLWKDIIALDIPVDYLIYSTLCGVPCALYFHWFFPFTHVLIPLYKYLRGFIIIFSALCSSSSRTHFQGISSSLFPFLSKTLAFWSWIISNHFLLMTRARSTVEGDPYCNLEVMTCESRYQSKEKFSEMHKNNWKDGWQLVNSAYIERPEVDISVKTLSEMNFLMGLGLLGHFSPYSPQAV